MFFNFGKPRVYAKASSFLDEQSEESVGKDLTRQQKYQTVIFFQMVGFRVICFLQNQRNLFGRDHSGNFKMYAIISEGYHKQPMITSYLSWLQRGLCVAKMVS